VIGAVREPGGVDPGKVTAVAGDRGAGPSVLTQTVSGLWEPTEGQITWSSETVQYTAPLTHSVAL
jgi:D-xylose transport system permease protein